MPLNGPASALHESESPITEPNPPRTRRRFVTPLIEAGLAVLTASISLLLAIVALRISPKELGERWTTGGADQVLHYAIFTSARDVFPFLPNPRLGFPDAQNLFFAPLFDPWSALFVRVISPIVPDGVWALNVYNVASFFAVGLTGYLFFRALRVRRVTAVVFGAIVSLLPYHFTQMAQGHPFLANYWAVPLIGVLVLIVAGGSADPLSGWAARGRTAISRTLRRLLPILALTIAVAWTQSYYFVFAALIVGSVWAARVLAVLIARRPVRTLLWPTVTLVSLGGFTGLQLAVLAQNQGDRFEKYFNGRLSEESEYYGGKITNLLLPSPTSGIELFAKAAKEYAGRGVVLTSENPSTAVIASIAMIVVLALIVVRLVLRPAATTAEATEAPRGARLLAFVQDDRIGALLVAFFVALLFFVVAGFGAVLAYLASPEIRAWSRMSIVLSVLALGVLAVLVDRIVVRIALLLPTLAVVSALVAVDQLAGIAAAVPIGQTDDGYIREFSAEAEDVLGPDCGIIQLPLKDFPETGNVADMGDYDEALPYLYTEDGDLRFSYGAVRGTHSADPWNDATTPSSFEAEAESSGACAILVDQYAYPDPAGWRDLVATVADPDAPAVTSTDDRERYLLFTIGTGAN